MKKYFIKFSKKTNRFSLLFLIFGTTILINFFKTQIMPNSHIEEIISKSGFKAISVYGERGKIYDTNNNELASQINKYDFWVNTKEYKDLNKNNKLEIAKVFSSIFNKPHEYYLGLLNKKRSYVPLEKNVPVNVAKNIISKSKKIKKLNYDIINSRIYKYNSLASQTIGCIDLDENAITGIEKYFDSELSSNKIEIMHKKGPQGKFYPAEEYNLNEINGYDIKLTLDIELQNILQSTLHQALKETSAKSANGILIESSTGKIRAIASIPDFDPNQYNKYKPNTYKNTVISDLYEPGSTFKIIPLALILESEKYNLQDYIFCENGQYRLPNNMHLNDHEPHGMLTIQHIMSFSSNIGFSKLADTFSNRELYKKIESFGLTAEPDLLINNVANGHIRNSNDWALIDKHYISIGQSISVSNLQLALAYCAIANGGKLLSPQLIEKIYKGNYVHYRDKYNIVREVLSPDISKQILSTLENTVLEGTAKNLGLDHYKIAGKTGTAQKFDVNNNVYHDSLYVASFASIFPSDNPKYVLLISIDEPIYGSTENYQYASKSAIPASRQVIAEILNIDDELKQLCLKDDLFKYDEIAIKNETK